MPAVGLGGSLNGRDAVFVRGEQVETVRVPWRLIANDVQPVIAAAEACGCIALLPDFCGPAGWTEVLPGWSTPDYQINAFRTASRGALPKVRLFLDALKDGFATTLRAPPALPG